MDSLFKYSTGKHIDTSSPVRVSAYSKDGKGRLRVRIDFCYDDGDYRLEHVREDDYFLRTVSGKFLRDLNINPRTNLVFWVKLKQDKGE